ncbi:beta-defensin 3-like [Mus pahari]|uniref:beta-defensin 3-like n=1 Tax=Mus pahari TaxID=10093 RepID=UPI000A31154D|nr:beta-defensin 3-like [Mus pahari]
MRIHYLLFAFLLVLLSPLAAKKKNNNPVSSFRKGRYCWDQCIGNTPQIGICTGFLKCCKR